MPDYVVIEGQKIPVPRHLRGDQKAIAAWIETQQHQPAPPTAPKE